MILLRHPLWVPAFLAASVASLLVACGGKVVVDAAGATGGGGAASMSTSSVGPGGVGGAGGCDGLLADFEAKLAAAQACNPALAVIQCTGAVTTVDLCGCPLVAYEGNPMAAQVATTAFKAWASGGCHPGACLPCPPPPPSPWFCDPTDAVCKPAFKK